MSGSAATSPATSPSNRKVRVWSFALYQLRIGILVDVHHYPNESLGRLSSTRRVGGFRMALNGRTYSLYRKEKIKTKLPYYQLNVHNT